MALDVNIDLSGVLRQLNALPEQAKAGVEDGLDEIVVIGEFAIERGADETYGRAIPQWDNGNPKWEREGDLKANQTTIRNVGELIFTTSGPAEAYEERLANLPDGSDGINRSNNIKQKAFDNIQPQVAPKIDTGCCEQDRATMIDANSKVTEFAALVQAEFTANHLAAFASYGGLKVTEQTKEKVRPLSVGKPRIQLTIESDVTSRWNGANGKLRDCIVKFEAVATDNNGGLIGVTNPTVAEIEAVRVLREYVLNNYSVLTNAGFTMPEIRMETSQTTSNSTETVSTSRGRFVFTYMYG